MKRPLSITLLALVQGLISSLSLIAGLFLLLLLTGKVEVFSQDLTALPLVLKGLVVLGEGISLWGLVATYGLWTLQRWGWVGSLIFQGLCLVNNGLGLLAGQSLSLGVYFSAGLSVSLMVALWMPPVRERFLATATESDAAA